MIQINLNNVEELLFHNQEVRKLLKDHQNWFKQWEIGVRVPGLRMLGKRAVLDFLNNVRESDILLLEQYFNDDVVVDVLDHQIAKHYKFPIREAQERMCELGEGSLAMHRDGDFLYISQWR